MRSLHFIAVWNEAGLKETFEVPPDGIEFGTTGFYLIETEAALIGVFVVTPETRSVETLGPFVADILRSLATKYGMALTLEAMLQTMQNIMNASAMSAKESH